MTIEPEYADLSAALQDEAAVMSEWMDCFASSVLRLPQRLDRESMASSVGPIMQALAEVVSPDRAGRLPVDLHFRAGSAALREIEKAVSFAASNLGARGLSAFDTGALLFALRDTLSSHLGAAERTEMQAYMEWLAVLAADSLATGREQALVEKWNHQLDEGTPLVMITPELPALFFVCSPPPSVMTNMFGRLVLTVVRTGALAVILDVRSLVGDTQGPFAQSLERFMNHQRVAHKTTIFGCGVRSGDADSWRQRAEAAGLSLILESHFDRCVTQALEIGGMRLVHTR